MLWEKNNFNAPNLQEAYRVKEVLFDQVQPELNNLKKEKEMSVSSRNNQLEGTKAIWY